MDSPIQNISFDLYSEFYNSEYIKSIIEFRIQSEIQILYSQFYNLYYGFYNPKYIKSILLYSRLCNLEYIYFFVLWIV